MYEVFIVRDDSCERVTKAPVDIIAAYSVIEEYQAEAAEDFDSVLNLVSFGWLRDQLINRMNKGNDYNIVSALTGEIVRRVHAAF